MLSCGIKNFDKKILGENLKFLRMQNNKTLDDVSWVCEISKQFLTQIEKGVSEPKATLLAKLIDLYEYQGTIKNLYKRVLHGTE